MACAVTPQERRRGWLLRALATLLLAMAFFELPGPVAPGLDPSHAVVLVHAHRHGLQFGPEVSFTYGPLGFLRAQHAHGDLPAALLAWRTAGMLALAATLVALVAPLPRARRALLGVALIAFWNDENTAVVCATLLVVAWLLPARPRPWWQVGVAVAWLAVLSHIKLTHLAHALCGIGVAAVTLAARGDGRRAVAVLGTFAAAFVAIWLAAGQALTNLPTYLHQGWHIASGFSRGMGVNELSWHVWLAGQVVVGALVLAGLSAARRRATWPALAFLFAAWFMVWKHGFTRADGHVVGFFVTTLLLSLALPPHLGARRWTWLDACPLLCVVGLASFDASIVGRLPRVVGERLSSGARALLRPEVRDDGRSGLDRPDLRAAIGRGTVDLLGWDQALVLANDLEYTPRPVFQSYSAYSGPLLRQNLAFFRSERAPGFVIARLQSIDGRFPTQDDGLVLAELPRRYEPLSWTSHDILLRRRGGDRGPETRELLLDRAVELGEEVTLPATRDRALWLRVEVEPTLRGRLRTLLVNEGRLNLVVTDDAGTTREHRLIPAMAEEGFVIQPLIEQQSELNAFLRGGGLRWVRSVRIAAPGRYRRCWGGVRLRLERLDVPVEPWSR